MGEEDIAIRSKFFKIMMPGFEETLKLPPAFCAKVGNEKSKTAILESCKGRWKVNVCRKDDEIIILEDGWPRFADEHELRLRDFLVFEHTGNLHFNVTVYDMSACQKQYPVDSDDDDHHQTIINNPIHHSKKKAPLRSQSRCFSYKLTHFAATNEKGKVNIPVGFARENNLTEKTGAVLKDRRRGREWRVRISTTNWPKIMVMMSTGWRDFVVDNNLKVGDVCTFQLNPIKSSTSKKVSFDVRISRSTKR